MGYRVSAKVDYAVRAAASLAATQLSVPGGATMSRAEDLARDLAIPPRFLVNILSDLRRAGLVASQRGAQGGYLLARGAANVTVGEVVKAVDPELLPEQHSKAFSQLWNQVSVAVDTILDGVSLADLVLAGGV
ncbi:MAG TPA: Rrf2 family transcriptional regulator [Acidimicrobiia bacterium]